MIYSLLIIHLILHCPHLATDSKTDRACCGLLLNMAVGVYLYVQLMRTRKIKLFPLLLITITIYLIIVFVFCFNTVTL